jgi:hypothetical protein
MIAGTVGLDPEPHDFRIVGLINCHLLYQVKDFVMKIVENNISLENN